MRNGKFYKCICYPQFECINLTSSETSSSSSEISASNSLSSSQRKKGFNVCQTNEGCYKSVKVHDGGRLEVRMGCFTNTNGRYLMNCHAHQAKNMRLECCRTPDFCNENLVISADKLANITSMSQTNSNTMAIPNSSNIQFNNPQSYVHIAFWIALPMSIIFIISCIFFMLWKFLPHSKKQKVNLKLFPHHDNINCHTNHHSNYPFPTGLYNNNTNHHLNINNNNRQYYSMFPYSSKFSSNNNNNKLNCGAPLITNNYNNHYQLQSNELNNYLGNIYNRNCWNGIKVLTSNGVPGSKSSSGVAGKSNYTATTLLSGPDIGSNDSTVDKFVSETFTSGSGRGLTHLVQRTIARQITLLDCIGNGKFGKVWKARFQGETVAVKIFSSREESSWARETKIYTTILLRHDNILGYYASDLISQSGCTELWMVMQYHEKGSLYEYLKQTDLVLDVCTGLRLAHSAAAGLCHLHTHIMGLQGKPPIAHRDIKSRNILVKSNDTCCIADLGLAVYPDPSDPDIAALMSSHGEGRVVGTRRYMCPEFLECALKSIENNSNTPNNQIYSNQDTNNNSSFTKIDSSHPIMLLRAHTDSFMEIMKAGDVYSFALVLWEIVNRINFDNKFCSYQIPFEDMVPTDPSFEEMYEVVVTKNIRPPISDDVKSNISPVVRILEECWHQRPSIRHSMLRVKKSLSALLASTVIQTTKNSSSNPHIITTTAACTTTTATATTSLLSSVENIPNNCCHHGNIDDYGYHSNNSHRNSHSGTVSTSNYSPVVISTMDEEDGDTDDDGVVGGGVTELPRGPDNNNNDNLTVLKINLTSPITKDDTEHEHHAR